MALVFSFSLTPLESEVLRAIAPVMGSMRSRRSSPLFSFLFRERLRLPCTL
ncbi:hypothetical protein D9M71_823900 [compost metagenome]